MVTKPLFYFYTPPNAMPESIIYILFLFVMPTLQLYFILLFFFVNKNICDLIDYYAVQVQGLQNLMGRRQTDSGLQKKNIKGMKWQSIVYISVKVACQLLFVHCQIAPAVKCIFTLKLILSIAGWFCQIKAVNGFLGFPFHQRGTLFLRLYRRSVRVSHPFIW